MTKTISNPAKIALRYMNIAEEQGDIQSAISTGEMYLQENYSDIPSVANHVKVLSKLEFLYKKHPERKEFYFTQRRIELCTEIIHLLKDKEHSSSASFACQKLFDLHKDTQPAAAILYLQLASQYTQNPDISQELQQRKMQYIHKCAASEIHISTFRLGNKYAKNGNNHVALTAFSIALECAHTQEQQAFSHKKIADIYRHNLQNPRAAIPHYEQAVSLEPYDEYKAAHLTSIAACHRSLRDFRAALETFEVSLPYRHNLREKAKTYQSIANIVTRTSHLENLPQAQALKQIVTTLQSLDGTTCDALSEEDTNRLHQISFATLQTAGLCDAAQKPTQLDPILAKLCMNQTGHSV